MDQTYRYGRKANRQQGTPESDRLLNKPEGGYPRSSQRAAPTGSTSFSDSTAANKKARDKKHKTGKYSRDRMFQ